MEAMGEWSAYPTTEEADFMAQLLGWSYEHHHGGGATSGDTATATATTTAPHPGFWTYQNQANFFGCGGGLGSFGLSREESGSYSAGNSGYYAAVTNNGSMSMDFDDVTISTSSYLVEERSDCHMEESVCVNRVRLEPVVEEKDVQLEISVKAGQPSDADHAVQKTRSSPCESTKKRSRASSGEVQKNNRRNTKSRKNQRSLEMNDNNNVEENKAKNKAVLNTQSSSNTCSSEDDSNGSQDMNGGAETSSFRGTKALNLDGKTRASRGAATDPQSLYARKRRERINERLRILQNLVPNGTKVDISTMLEEAVHYVKFLQLQIKLLSSDDLWMYAPIAYNGMDIGLDKLTGP